MYVNTKGISSRVKPIPGSDKVKSYSLNDEVEVVAKTNTSYYKLKDGTFIHTDYLGTNWIENSTPQQWEHEEPDYESFYGIGKYKIGDKKPSGYTVIGITSNGIPYVALDEEYEISGAVIFDYNKFGNPMYVDDPKKWEEILEKALNDPANAHWELFS